MGELLRLFGNSEPLEAMREETLGPRGLLSRADTVAGAMARNTLHNRVPATAFIPAGGRPASLNGSNWRDFLLEDGTPSARLIVEGANLFVTNEARQVCSAADLAPPYASPRSRPGMLSRRARVCQALFDHSRLPIVKDSSANKCAPPRRASTRGGEGRRGGGHRARLCGAPRPLSRRCGVVCSSLEIVASMLLSTDEFAELKADYVDHTLVKLRSLARDEAELLFAEVSRDRAEIAQRCMAGMSLAEISRSVVMHVRICGRSCSRRAVRTCRCRYSRSASPSRSCAPPTRAHNNSTRSTR